MDDRETRTGRPVVTSREEIEQVAFELFEQLGYERTSMARIADEVGVGRRTIFRYFASKHEIPWGGFDRELPRFAALLDAQPLEMTMFDAVLSAVTQLNDLAESAMAGHASRMRLIMQEPSLQSYSSLRYVQWRAVIEGYVAERAACRPDDPLPRLIAFTANAVSIAAYTEWLRDTDRPLRQSFDGARALLRAHLA